MAHATLSDMDTRYTHEAASLSSLRSFAHKKGVDETLAVKIYEEEISELDIEARVKKYLPLLAEKRTKNRLRAF